MLRDLAEQLDISLELLLRTAGYSGIVVNFRDKSYNNKSTRDLKNLIDQYRESQMDLLQDSNDKRSNVADCRTRLRSMMFKLEDYDYYKEIFPPEKILE